ncbi:MAG: hypothetical protein M1830_004970, partial [Pleopsidium flavum]
VSLETVVEYLLQAPKITRELAAMNWMFLNAPADGSVMLVWQPLNQLGTQFASDGYVWADVEQAFSSEAKGYTVEMYIHRTGYHPPNEIMSTHCRRRYRLMPPKNPNPNIAPCDPSLWIVHYSRADPQNHYPANKIPLVPQVQVSLAQRQYLQQYGQLVRKEFMFNDRNNWPTINLPGGQAPSYAQPSGAYPNNILSQLSRSQEQPYYQQQPMSSITRGVGPSPAKRPRQTPPSHMPGSSGSIAAATIAQDSVEEEEDTSRGDLMDFLTPRDISNMRYTQHHEWMEEVFSSAYPTGKIIPVELGLGRKGELEELTKGFFEAPTSPGHDAQAENGHARVGKMEAGMAEDFTKRATDKIAQMKAEMERLRRQHAKRMAKIDRGNIVKEAEVRLRTAVNDPSDTGTEIWRLEGQLEVPAEVASSEAGATAAKRKEKVDDIVKEVEAAVGKRIGIIKDQVCVQKGGLEEKTVGNDDSHNSYNSTDAFSGDHTGDGDIDMGVSPAGPRDQSILSTSTPVQDMPAPQALPSNHRDPAAADASASQLDESSRPIPGIGNRGGPIYNDQAISRTADMDVDVDMAGEPNDYASHSAEGEPGDWVMVHKGGEDTAQLREDFEHGTLLEEQVLAQQSIGTPGVFVNTPASDLQGLTPHEQGSGHEELDTNDFGDFGELDTAGDALSGYEAPDGEVGLDDQGELGIDTSAFGDALHGTEGHGDLPNVAHPDEASL